MIRQKNSIGVLVMLALLFPAALSAQRGQGDPKVLAMMHRVNK